MSVFDMNGDGRPDIVTGEHRGALRLSVWENLDGGTTWLQHVVDTGKESHLGARVVDLDGNGTRDVVSIAFDAEEDLHLWRLEAVPEPGARLQAYVALLVLAALRCGRRGMSLPRLVH